MLNQIISLAGAFLILAAYGANQWGVLNTRDWRYSLANLIGSLLLLWIAVLDRRAGFVVLEAAWALISLVQLLAPRRPPQSPNPA